MRIYFDNKAWKKIMVLILTINLILAVSLVVKADATDLEKKEPENIEDILTPEQIKQLDKMMVKELNKVFPSKEERAKIQTELNDYIAIVNENAIDLGEGMYLAQIEKQYNAQKFESNLFVTIYITNNQMKQVFATRTKDISKIFGDLIGEGIKNKEDHMTSMFHSAIRLGYTVIISYVGKDRFYFANNYTLKDI